MSNNNKAQRTPAKNFIEIWQTSSSMKEVCDRTGLKEPSAYTRARGYRAKGIPLKQFKKIRNDWGQLRELAMSFLTEEERQALAEDTAFDNSQDQDLEVVG